MDVDKAYLRRIRRMTPEQRVIIAIGLAETVREIAIKGIMDSKNVSYSKARNILRERLMK